MTIWKLVKRAIKRNMPAWLYRKWLLANSETYGMPTAEVFSAIYRKGMWGSQDSQKFYSGDGSHNEKIVAPYVAAVSALFQKFLKPPKVVDLGCGDFNVGRLIVPYCEKYIACDVVGDLIAHNAKTFITVNFKQIDIISDDLPHGEVAFLREVLQHLTNAQIVAIIPKLRNYQYLIVTEHLPLGDGFVPNIDHPTGPGIRLSLGSGVVLTSFPFSLRVKSESVLCEVVSDGGVIRTTLYAF